ncbi:hypothetical protein KsCSTR_04180 [Candidatus Kuenenia stuttgartiensis]|uniref:Uncharacterized protein n=1 Tax=Kuenenia stuttgartiensis TaxID=174633 RepID=A0A6G7GKQ6_KUEST|nr:hypothetical protein KsCSTR_04180 [Candidatus Kuenenia stuttgartiensis]
MDSWFSKKRSTLGSARVLTLAGIPMIFEALELREDRWFQDKDHRFPSLGQTISNR